MSEPEHKDTKFHNTACDSKTKTNNMEDQSCALPGTSD